MSNYSDRLTRIETEIHGNGRTGLKERLVMVEEAIKGIPSIKKKVDINTVMTATTLALVLRPNAVDALNWLFKFLHL